MQRTALAASGWDHVVSKSLGWQPQAIAAARIGCSHSIFTVTLIQIVTQKFTFPAIKGCTSAGCSKLLLLHVGTHPVSRHTLS